MAPSALTEPQPPAALQRRVEAGDGFAAEGGMKDLADVHRQQFVGREAGNLPAAAGGAGEAVGPATV